MKGPLQTPQHFDFRKTKRIFTMKIMDLRMDLAKLTRDAKYIHGKILEKTQFLGF